MPAMPRDAEAVESFPPALARAVADVLRQAGLPAWTVPRADGDHEVRVPPGRRQEALTALAARMDAVRERAGHPGAAGGLVLSEDAVSDLDDEEAGGPIVMERIRRFGVAVAFLLAPLLAITLASPPLPLAWSAAAYVTAALALLWWRSSRR